MRTSVAAVLAGLLFGVSVQSAAAAPPSREAFAAPPAFETVAVSPSGARLARVAQKNDVYVIQVFDTSKLEAGPTAEYALGPARKPRWLHWKGESRLVLSLWMVQPRAGQLEAETRLIAFDAALKRPVMLGQPKRIEVVPMDQDNVVSFLPDDPRGLLLAIDWHQPVWPSVVRVDVTTNQITTVRRRDDRVVGWLADPEGVVRLGIGDPFKEDAAAFYLVGADGELSPLQPRVAGGTVFQALGFDGDGDRLVVRSDHEGGTIGLYVYSLSKNAFIETVFKDPKYDVGAALFSADGARLVGHYHTDHVGRVRYTDPAEAARVKAVTDLTGAKEAYLRDESADGRFAVVSAVENDRVVESFWVDVQAKTARSLGRHRPDLDGVALGKVVPVSYKARDGLEIPAYLTLPPGVETLEAAKRLPFVVMPHGGPESRDSADFDWWAQFVATRGYGVLQPNFRGSTGYGQAFRKAGEREWGEAIQDDVADGARWLVDQGLADAGRMCIAGWSFGGYVALMAAVENADLFRCASATAPVSDLLALIGDQGQYYGGDEVMRRMIGGGWRDRSRLVEASPARRTDEVSMPVLLTHGGVDPVVRVSHSRKMRDRLQRAGKPFEYIEFEFADHDLAARKDRLRLLEAMERFLAAHIGAGDTKAAGASK